ncbi:hypothetical protein HMN09_00691000 [Mycena chlorophos]|uniref:ATP-dependent (S)-NAD(P)H-hydrate dehydratase n=1 Tax=Mycena chlorophos TaxID=658473 RepID=A0A8H6T132_MYCCL|nr:hypothetical protein HMN09_00691000 [Mycena chlorophos]
MVVARSGHCGHVMTQCCRKLGHQLPSTMALAWKALLGQVKQLIPPLDGSLHKGQSGRVGVLGGALDYTGAPYFAAISALRFGCDLSHVLCSPTAAGAIKSYSPDLIVHPILREDAPTEHVSSELKSILSRLHVLVIGPGLGREPYMQSFAKIALSLAKQQGLFVVLDADALWLVGQDISVVKGYRRAVVTPNVAEFARLSSQLGIDPNSPADKRAALVSRALGGVTVLQKGAKDIISVDAEHAETVFVDVEGGLKRCGGQGDILSGTVGTMLAWAKCYEDGVFGDKSLPTARLPLLAAIGGSTVTRTASRRAFSREGRGVVTQDMLSEVGKAFAETFGEELQGKLSSSSEEEKMSDVKPPKPASSRKTTTATAPPSPAKQPKKVDVHLPGPSPRSATASTSKPESKTGSPLTKTNIKAIHARSSSSISSMKKVLDDGASASPSSATKKPASTVSRKRMATPETVDDNASVAESSVMGGAIRRTEAERIEYFKNQPDCAELEPHSVKCTRCNKTVSLGRQRPYTVKPWETHRRKCDQKLPAGSVIDDSASVVASEVQSTAGGTPRGPRKTAEERKAELEADERAEKVSPDQALCRKCQKWIKLSPKSPYALANWTKHQQSCGDEQVSSRVATAKRKIALVNDAQAKTKGPRFVECAICKATIELVGDQDYTLTNWEQHKQTCPAPSTSKAKGKGKNKAALPTAASTAATDASASRGVKRRLEDADLEAEDPDAREANRPRKEGYKPVQKEAPGMFGWFLMPFKAFLTGFKESIGDAASPEPEQDVDEPNEPEDRDAHGPGPYRAEVAPVPEFTRWKSWDWSQLRCSFRAPDY